MMIAVIRALGVFAAERKRQLEMLEREHQRAQHQALVARQALPGGGALDRGAGADRPPDRDAEPLDDILAGSLERARVLLGADRAALALWDDQYSSLIVKAAAGEGEAALLNRRISDGRFGCGPGAAGDAVARRDAVAV